MSLKQKRCSANELAETPRRHGDPPMTDIILHHYDISPYSRHLSLFGDSSDWMDLMTPTLSSFVRNRPRR